MDDNVSRDGKDVTLPKCTERVTLTKVSSKEWNPLPVIQQPLQYGPGKTILKIERILAVQRASSSDPHGTYHITTCSTIK